MKQLSESKILITGNNGFLGRAIVSFINNHYPKSHLFLLDNVQDKSNYNFASKLVIADLCDPTAFSLLESDFDYVFHLASYTSREVEECFDKGLKNIQSTINLLEFCRKCNNSPVVVFSSSLACFGGSQLPFEVPDYAHQHPETTYGVSKVICEQLLNDYSRRGFIDGRGIRLPALIIREESNTKAASSYVNELIKSTIKNESYICPVSKETRIPLLSIKCAVSNLIKLAIVDLFMLKGFRVFNSPNLSPSVTEIIDLLEQYLGRNCKNISFEIDETTMKIIKSWPINIRFDEANRLGLQCDESLLDVIMDYNLNLYK